MAPAGTSVNPPAAANSVSPTLADDTDGDKFIEVMEGLPRYGNILLPLTTVSGIDNDGDFNFPLADALGNLNYDVTFDLNDTGNFQDPMNPGLMLDRGDIFPLDLREVVLHGRNVGRRPRRGHAQRGQRPHHRPRHAQRSRLRHGAAGGVGADRGRARARVAGPSRPRRPGPSPPPAALNRRPIPLSDPTFHDAPGNPAGRVVLRNCRIQDDCEFPALPPAGRRPNLGTERIPLSGI